MAKDAGLQIMPCRLLEGEKEEITSRIENLSHERT